MLLKDISFQCPEDNIHYDDVLLELAEQDRTGEILRLWESPVSFVVLGRIGKPEQDVHVSLAFQDRIPILRRSSGGGTVLQGRGCLNYSLILCIQDHPGLRDIRKSYQILLQNIIALLEPLGVHCAIRAVSDLVLLPEEKKFCGNAQRRRRKFLLHHGTILYDFDISLMERYLKIPMSMPEYRRKRSHEDFVANVKVPVNAMKKAFRDYFGISESQEIPSPEETRILGQKALDF